MTYIDLTHTFTAKMPVFPGDDAAELKENFSAEEEIYHFHISTGMHVGTHMDAPLHMLSKGNKLSDYPPEKFIGTALVLDAKGSKSIKADIIRTTPHLDTNNPPDIILLNTGFHHKFNTPEYYANYPEISEELAHALTELNIKIIGMDTPSPDRAPYKIHRILLSQDILIIENLTNLDALPFKTPFKLYALPAKFEAEAAPVRVIAEI